MSVAPCIPVLSNPKYRFWGITVIVVIVLFCKPGAQVVNAYADVSALVMLIISECIGGQVPTGSLSTGAEAAGGGRRRWFVSRFGVSRQSG
jgi:hypothetical protein